MNVHHDKKTVDIWLTRSEARDDNFRKSLEPYYQQFKEKKYFVSVFESGERDLFSEGWKMVFSTAERMNRFGPTLQKTDLTKSCCYVATAHRFI